MNYKPFFLGAIAAALLIPPIPATACGPIMSEGTFAPWQDGAVAVTYDQALAPAGSHAKVVIDSDDDKTTATLTVTGLLPNRVYGSHAHLKSCGAKPADSGFHYQNVEDPNANGKMSMDAKYANPHNELWLDFTTDEHGDATQVSTVEWTFRTSEPASIVVHEKKTDTTDGNAGMAGARVACLSIPLP
ncbi:superoxide dismutase family protein [Nocardia sp. NPDC046473]|uniref:superoxide dismutase family protein n=1 Tax=Nocardia sp. NPDC046473 TaxID=3155733 RepID=UPI0033F14903